MKTHMPLGWFASSGILLIGGVSMLHAEDSKFLPGDSHFRSVLTGDALASMESASDGTVTLQYEFEQSDHDFVGYRNLEIQGFQQSTAKNLRRLYTSIRSVEFPEYRISTVDGIEHRQELNGIPLYVYDDTFEWQTYRIGLRYNETWEADGASFSRSRFLLNYPGRAESADAIIEDWRNAGRVSALKTILPTATYDLKPLALRTTPVKVKGNEVVFFVVPVVAIQAIKEGSSDGIWFYLVKQDKIEVVRYSEGQWSKGLWQERQK